MSPQSKSRSSRPAGAGFVFEKLRNNVAAHKNTPDASARLSSTLFNAGPYGRITAVADICGHHLAAPFRKCSSDQLRPRRRRRIRDAFLAFGGNAVLQSLSKY